MPVTIDSTNSTLSTTGTAYSQATADPLTIAANGYLLSTVDDALLLNGTSQAYEVTVNGDVSTFATARAGIYLSDLTSSAAITVGTTGHVYGNGQGIYSVGLATITNNGSIAGATGVGIYNGGNGDFTITNNGRISSDSVVAISLSGTGTHSINNSGTIKAATGQDAIQSTNPTGVEIVYNNALIDGNVNLGGGHDEYYGSFGGTVQGSINMGDGADTFYGGPNTDYAFGGNDADYMHGNAGHDELNGDAGGDTLNGGLGDDILTGGTGDDLYIVNSSGDDIVEIAGDTGDRVQSSVSFALEAADHVEFLETTSAVATTSIKLTGNNLAQTISGNAGANILSAGGGNDILVGGLGRDKLTGGSGYDNFDFNARNETGKTAATRDVITDFVHGIDDIDLSQIDASTSRSGNQAFRFIGTIDFRGVAGELHYSHVGSKTIIEGDVNGDGRADFQIELLGRKVLSGGDFDL